jgi:hypothetical protein
MTRDESNYIPVYARPSTGVRKPFRHEVIADRKARFASLLKYVTARNGWLTSVPGEIDVTMECLPDSSLPDELRAGAEYMIGDETVRLPPYKVVEDGEGERILPHAITTRIVGDADGVHPVTEGSSSRPVITITHAGIVKTRRFSFTLP